MTHSDVLKAAGLGESDLAGVAGTAQGLDCLASLQRGEICRVEQHDVDMIGLQSPERLLDRLSDCRR